MVKKLSFLLIILFMITLFGCGEKPVEADPKPAEPVIIPKEDEEAPEPIDDPVEVDPFLGFETEYSLFVGEKIDFEELYKDKLDSFEVSVSNNVLVVRGKIVEAVREGSSKVVILSGDNTLIIDVTVSLKKEFKIMDEYVSDGEFELFLNEEVALPIALYNCTIDDLEITVGNDNIEVNGWKIKGLKIGESTVKIKLGDVTGLLLVYVKPLKVTVLNDNFNIDCLDTLKIHLQYPKNLVDESDINYYLYKSDIIEIKDNTIYPLREGKVKVRVQIGDDKDTGTVFEVNVTVDPIAIITSLNQENALMLREIRLYGEDSNGQPAYVTQEFMGSVSYYFFSQLNLIEQIIDIYDNPYVGMTATPEIINQIDKKKNKECPGYPRSGVLLTGINYITYHDTGNFNPGAKSQSNANWMTNSYSIAATARSWHYTVDEDQVIHSIPDNEVTFQGDHYTAYTESIGIETCVNQGANLDKVWHRMGKLCARLMVKYGIDVNHIKQHYDWMGKNCPQTLRMNNLYDYAIRMVKAELVVKKYLGDYTIKFESLNPEYVDDTGQIIKAPLEEIVVSYKVTITNNSGYNESVVLQTKIKPFN